MLGRRQLGWLVGVGVGVGLRLVSVRVSRGPGLEAAVLLRHIGAAVGHDWSWSEGLRNVY